jgi:hypothetical protein
LPITMECGPEGLEVHFCRRICFLLREQHGATFAERVVPMDNKRRLLEGAATAASALLAEGFDRLVILWDEEPSWPDKHESLCWHGEKEHLLATIGGQGLDREAVHLVCIERAFESWLLFDEGLLSRFLSRPAHPVRVRAPANPHRLRNAKGVMMKLFRKHRRTYVDVSMGAQLASKLENLTRLRRCKTFRRFVEGILGRAL